MLRDRIGLEDDVRHEFGHVVVAKLLGFETGKVLAHMGGAKAEIVLTPTFQSLADVARYSRRRIQVLYAGTGAQALKNGEIDGALAESLLGEGGANDHAKIRELVRIVGAIERPDAVDEKSRGEVATALDTELRFKTGDLVEQNTPLILDLTSYFLSEVGAARASFELSAEVIDRFPGVPDLRAELGTAARMPDGLRKWRPRLGN